MASPLGRNDRIITFTSKAQAHKFFDFLDTRYPGGSNALKSIGITTSLDLEGTIDSRVSRLIGNEVCITPVLEQSGFGLSLVNHIQERKAVDSSSLLSYKREEESTVNSLLQECVSRPVPLGLFAMGFDPPFYLPKDWDQFIRRKVSGNTIAHDRFQDPLVAVSHHPISTTLISLGFQRLTDLPIGWRYVLGLYLPEVEIDPSCPDGISPSKFWWQTTFIGYSPDWKFRVPQQIAEISVSSLAKNIPFALELKNVFGLERLSDLTSKSSGDFSDKALSKLFSLGIHPAPNSGQYLAVKTLSKASQLVKLLLSSNGFEQLGLSARNWQIFGEKLDTSDTLEQIGERCSLTRERVRQVVKRCLRCLGSKIEIDLVFVEVFGIICQAGGILTTETFFEALKKELPFEGLRRFLALLEICFKNLVVDDENGVVTCRGRQGLTSFLSELIDRVSDMCPATESYVRQEIKTIVSRECLTDSALVGVLEVYLKSQGLVGQADGRIAFGYGSLSVRYGEAFKKLFPKGLAIYRESERLLKEFRKHFGLTARVTSERAVQGCLVSNPDIVLFARGCYIHTDNLKIDPHAVDLAIERCEELFESGMTRFNLSRVFGELKARLEDAGIARVELLHSLIRRRSTATVGMGRCPHVFDRRRHEARIPRSKEVERFVEQAFESRVTLDRLSQEFCERRGWKEYSLYNAIAESDQIVSYNNGEYILSSAIEIDIKSLEALADYLDLKTRKYRGRVELKIIQEERGVLWRHQLSGHPMPFILSKLKEAFPDRFLYLPTAAVAAPESNYTNVSIDMAEYLRAAGKAVYVDELKREFLDRRGWKETAYRIALKDETIVKYARKSYIHISKLHWSRDKADLLEEALMELLSQTALREDRPFLSFSEVVESYYAKLPSLPPGYLWSPELLESLSQCFSSVIKVGLALVRNGSIYDIGDFDDLIAYLLAKHFRGATSEKEIMKFLKKHGVYSGNRVPAQALNPGSSITRSAAGEVYLSEKGRERYAHLIPVTLERGI